MAHFLVVNDEPSIRELLRAVLEHAGHTVDDAEDGLVAEKLVLRRDYDGIFTNQRMPGCDGTEFLERVRHIVEGRTPCALDSGDTFPETIEAASNAGALWFLGLPLDVERFQRVAEQMLLVRKAYVAPETLTIEEVRGTENVEIRRILREGFGEDRYLAETGAELVHIDSVPIDRLAPGGRSITRALLEDEEGRRFLVASDGSTRRVYHMEVPRSCETCAQAYVALSGRPDVRTIIEA